MTSNRVIKKNKIKIAIISGSYSPQSLVRTALKQVEKILRKQGIQTTFICIRERSIPIFDPTEKTPIKNVEWIRKKIKEADGLLVGSPEYHSSLSGALKNLIDYLNFEHVEGKPVAVLSTTGSHRSGTNTLNALRIIFRSLHAPVIVQQLSIWAGDFDPEKRNFNESSLNLVHQLLKALIDEISG